MLGKISHIFQIPLSWYRAVDRLLHTHSGDCITYDANAESGPVIAVDTQRITAQVQSGLDIDSITAQVQSGLDIDSITAQVQSGLDIDSITAQVQSGLDQSAQDPPAASNAINDIPGTASPNATTWIAGGQYGLALRVQTRTTWTGTVLYGFCRELVFDQDGKLYRLTAETRYTIDTPVTYNT